MSSQTSVWSAQHSIWKDQEEFCFCFSITKSCPTLCNSLDCSTPGFSVLHYLPEFAQTHAHWINDTILISLNQWYQWYPTILSSVILFSSCPQSFPASGSFPMNWLFSSGGQRIGASAPVLPVNIKVLFPLGLTGLITLLSKELSRVFSSTTIWKQEETYHKSYLWWVSWPWR